VLLSDASSIFTGRVGNAPNMTTKRTGDPGASLERAGDELEERLGALGDHIEDAERQARERRDEATPLESVAGDWEDTDDEAGGQDPAGAGER
jgi:hypothetical protein